MAAVDKNNVLPKNNELDLGKISYDENTPLSDIAKQTNEVAKPISRLSLAAANDVHDRQTKLIGNDFGKVNPMNYATYYQPAANDARSSARVLGAEQAFEEGMDRGKKAAEANYNSAKSAYDSSVDAYNNAKEAFSNLEVAELPENLLPFGLTQTDLLNSDVLSNKEKARNYVTDSLNKMYNIDYSKKDVWNKSVADTIKEAGIDTSAFKQNDWDSYWGSDKISTIFNKNYALNYYKANGDEGAIKSYTDAYNKFVTYTDSIVDYISGVTDELEAPNIDIVPHATDDIITFGMNRILNGVDENGQTRGIEYEIQEIGEDIVSGLLHEDNKTLESTVVEQAQNDLAEKTSSIKLLNLFTNMQSKLKAFAEKVATDEKSLKRFSETANSYFSDYTRNILGMTASLKGQISSAKDLKTRQEIINSYNNAVKRATNSLEADLYNTACTHLDRDKVTSAVSDLPYGDINMSSFKDFFGMSFVDILTIKKWKETRPEEYESFKLQLASVAGQLNSIEVADGKRYYYIAGEYKQLKAGTPVFFTYNGALNPDGSIKDPDLKNFVEVWKDFYSTDIQNVSASELTQKTAAFNEAYANYMGNVARAIRAGQVYDTKITPDFYTAILASKSNVGESDLKINGTEIKEYIKKLRDMDNGDFRRYMSGLLQAANANNGYYYRKTKDGIAQQSFYYPTDSDMGELESMYSSAGRSDTSTTATPNLFNGGTGGLDIPTDPSEAAALLTVALTSMEQYNKGSTENNINPGKFERSILDKWWMAFEENVWGATRSIDSLIHLIGGTINWAFGDHSNPFEHGGDHSFANVWGALGSGKTDLNPQQHIADFMLASIQADKAARENLFNIINPMLEDVYYGDMKIEDVKGVGDWYSTEDKWWLGSVSAAVNTVINFSAMFAEMYAENALFGFSANLLAKSGSSIIKSIGRRFEAAKTAFVNKFGKKLSIGDFSEFINNTDYARHTINSEKIAKNIAGVVDKIDNVDDPIQIKSALGKDKVDDFIDTLEGSSNEAKGLNIYDAAQNEPLFSQFNTAKDAIVAGGEETITVTKYLRALQKQNAIQHSITNMLSSSLADGSLVSGTVGSLSAKQAAAISSVATSSGEQLVNFFSGFIDKTRTFFKKLKNSDFSNLEMSKLIAGYNNGIVTTIGGQKLTVSEMAAVLSARDGLQGFVIAATTGLPVESIAALPSRVKNTLSKIINGMTASEGMSVITNAGLRDFLRTLSPKDLKELTSNIIDRNFFNATIGKKWDAYDLYRVSADLGWEKAGRTALARMFITDALTDPLRDFARNVKIPQVDSEGNFRTQTIAQYFTDPENIITNLAMSTIHFGVQRGIAEVGNTIWGRRLKQAVDAYDQVKDHGGKAAKEAYNKAIEANYRALEYADKAWKNGANYERVMEQYNAANNSLETAIKENFSRQGWDMHEFLGLGIDTNHYNTAEEFFTHMGKNKIPVAHSLKVISTTINVKSALNYGVFKAQIGTKIGELGNLSDRQYLRLETKMNELKKMYAEAYAKDIATEGFVNVFHEVNQCVISDLVALNAKGEFDLPIKNFEKSLNAYFSWIEAAVKEGLDNGDIIRPRLDYLPISSMYFQGSYDDMLSTHVNAATRGYLLKGSNLDMAAADPGEAREMISLDDILEHFTNGDKTFDLIDEHGRKTTFQLDWKGLNPIDQLTVYTNRFNMHKYLDRLLGPGRQEAGIAGAANGWVVLRANVAELASKIYDTELARAKSRLFGYDYFDENGVKMHSEGLAERGISKLLAEGKITAKEAAELYRVGHTTTELGRSLEAQLADVNKEISDLRRANNALSKTETGTDIPIGGFRELAKTFFNDASRSDDAKLLWATAEKVANKIKKAYADGKITRDDANRFYRLDEKLNNKWKTEVYSKIRVDDEMMDQLEHIFDPSNENQGKITSDFVHSVLLQWDVAKRFYSKKNKYHKADVEIPDYLYTSRLRNIDEGRTTVDFTKRSKEFQYYDVSKSINENDAIFAAGTGDRTFTLSNGKTLTINLDGKSVAQVSAELKKADPSEFVPRENARANTEVSTFEASTAGHKEFSALNAKFADGTKIMDIDISGKTIEDVLQNVLKGSGKNKAPAADSPIGKATAEAEKKAGRKLTVAEKKTVTQNFLNRLYDIWGEQNPKLKAQIEALPEGTKITDKFAKEGHASQAVALQRWVKKAGGSKPATQIQRAEVVNAPGANKNPSLTKSYAKEIGGVDVLRHADENGMHYGNPFSPLDNTSAQVKTKSIAEAVDNFRKWLRGEAFQDVEPKRRQWILNQINSGALDGKKLVYYTDEVPGKDYYKNGGEKIATYDAKTAPSHAHVLAELVNERNSNAVSTYSGNIKPGDNVVFVFGSNPIGVNGILDKNGKGKDSGGAAAVAQRYFGVKPGEIMDNKMSESGQAYGLVTVTKPGAKKSLTPEQITENIKKMYSTAEANPDKTFKVAYRSDNNLNGYSLSEMASMFKNAGAIPNNVQFSEEMGKLLNSQVSAPAVSKPTGARPNPDLPLRKIISGAQTGVDTIGLEIGNELGYETGGTTTPGFVREKGYDLHNSDTLSALGVKEIDAKTQAERSDAGFFIPRTEENVKNSDGTAYFKTKRDSAGYIATKKASERFSKPFLELSNRDTVEYNAAKLKDWLKHNNIETLNIAGNRGPLLGDFDVENILRTALGADEKPNARVYGVRNDSELWREWMKQNPEAVQGIIENSAGKQLTYDTEAGYGASNQSAAIREILSSDYGRVEPFENYRFEDGLTYARAQALRLGLEEARNNAIARGIEGADKMITYGYDGVDIFNTHLDTNELSTEFNLSRAEDGNVEVTSSQYQFRKCENIANDMIYSALGLDITKEGDKYVKQPGQQYRRIADGIIDRAKTQLADRSWGFNTVDWIREIDRCCGDLDLMKRAFANEITVKTTKGPVKRNLIHRMVAIEKANGLDILKNKLDESSAQVMSGTYDDVLPGGLSRSAVVTKFRNAYDFVNGVIEHNNRPKSMDAKSVDFNESNNDFEFNDNDDLSYKSSDVNTSFEADRETSGINNFLSSSFKRKYGVRDTFTDDSALLSAINDRTWLKSEALTGINDLITILDAINNPDNPLHGIASKMGLQEKIDINTKINDANEDLVHKLNNTIKTIYETGDVSSELKAIVDEAIKGTARELSVDELVDIVSKKTGEQANRVDVSRAKLNNMIETAKAGSKTRREVATFNLRKSSFNADEDIDPNKVPALIYASAFGVSSKNRILSSVGQSPSQYNAAMMNLSDGTFEQGWSADYTLSRIEAASPALQANRLAAAFLKLHTMSSDKSAYVEDLTKAIGNLNEAIGKNSARSAEANRYKLNVDFQKVDPVVAEYKNLLKYNPELAKTFKDPIVEKYISMKYKDGNAPSYSAIYSSKDFRYSIESRIKSLDSMYANKADYDRMLSSIVDTVKAESNKYWETKLPTSATDNFENSFVSFSSDVYDNQAKLDTQSASEYNRQLNNAKQRLNTVASLTVSGKVQDADLSNEMLEDLRRYKDAGPDQDKVGKELFEKYSGRKFLGLNEDNTSRYLGVTNAKISENLDRIYNIGDVYNMSKDTSTHARKKDSAIVKYTSKEKATAYNAYEKAYQSFTQKFNKFKSQFDGVSQLDKDSLVKFNKINKELDNIGRTLYEPGYREFKDSFSENNVKFIHEYGKDFRKQYMADISKFSDAGRITKVIDNTINKIQNNADAASKYSGYLDYLKNAKEEFAELSSKKINKEVTVATIKEVTNRLNELSSVFKTKEPVNPGEEMLSKGAFRETVTSGGSRSYDFGGEQSPEYIAEAKELIGEKPAGWTIADERMYKTFINRLDRGASAINNIDETIAELEAKAKEASDGLKWDSDVKGKKSIVPEDMKRYLASVSEKPNTGTPFQQTIELDSAPEIGEILVNTEYGSAASETEGSMFYVLTDKNGVELDYDSLSDAAKRELVDKLNEDAITHGNRIIRESELYDDSYAVELKNARDYATANGEEFNEGEFAERYWYSKKNPIDRNVIEHKSRDGSTWYSLEEIVDADGKPVRTTPEVLREKLQVVFDQIDRDIKIAQDEAAEARKDGDLSENEPYRAAKEKERSLKKQRKYLEELSGTLYGSLTVRDGYTGNILQNLFDDYVVAELEYNEPGYGELDDFTVPTTKPDNQALVDNARADWASFTANYNPDDATGKISDSQDATNAKIAELMKKADAISTKAESERLGLSDVAKMAGYTEGEIKLLNSQYKDWVRVRDTKPADMEDADIMRINGRKLTVVGNDKSADGYVPISYYYKTLGFPYDDAEALKTFNYDVSENRKYTDEEVKADRKARKKMKKELKKNLKSGNLVYKNLEKFKLPNDLDYRSRILSINNFRALEDQINSLVDMGKDEKGNKIKYQASPDDILIDKNFGDMIMRCSREGIGKDGVAEFLKKSALEFNDWNQFIQEFQLAGGIHTVNALSIAQLRGAIYTNRGAFIQYLKLVGDFKDDASTQRFFTENQDKLAMIASYNNASELLTSFMASASHEPGLEDGGSISLVINKFLQGIDDYKAISRDAGSKYKFAKSFVQTIANAAFSDSTFQRVLPVLQAKMLINYYDQAVSAIKNKIGLDEFTPDQVSRYASQLAYLKVTEFFEPRKMANINMTTNKASDALARIDDERIRNLYSSITGAQADMTFGEFCRNLFFALGYKNRMVRPLFQGARSLARKTLGIGEFADADNFAGMTKGEAIDKLGAQFTYEGAREQVKSLAIIAVAAFASAKLLGLSTPWDDLSFEDENGDFKVPEILTKFQTVGQIWVPNAFDEKRGFYVDTNKKAFNLDMMSSMFTIPNTLWRTVDRTFNKNGYYSAPQRGVGLISQELGINPQGLNNILNTPFLRAIGDELIGSNLLSPYKAAWEVLTDSTYFGNNIWEKKYLSDGSINKNYDPARNIKASFFHILGFDNLLDPSGYNRFVKGYYSGNYTKQDQIGTVSGSGIFQHEYTTALFKMLDGDMLGGIVEGGELPLKFKKFSTAARTDFNTRIKNIIAQNMADYKNKIANLTDPDKKEQVYNDTVKKCADVVAKWSAKYNYVLGQNQEIVPYVTRTLMAMLAGEYDDRLDYVQNAYWKASQIAQIEASDNYGLFMDDANYEDWVKSGKDPEEFAKEKTKRINAYYEALDEEYKARKALRDAGYDTDYLAGFTKENLKAEQRSINKEVYYGVMQKLNSKVGEFDNYKEMKAYYEAQIDATTSTKTKAKLAKQYNTYVEDALAPYIEKYGEGIIADGYYNGDYLSNSLADFIILPADEYYRGKNPRANYLKDMFGVGYRNKENLPSDDEVIEGYSKALTEANKGYAASASAILDRLIEDIKKNRIYSDNESYSKIIRLKALLSARSK